IVVVVIMSDKLEQRLDHVLNISQSNAETVKTQARLIHELILKFSSCQQSSKHKICTSEGAELNHKENWLCPVLPCTKHWSDGHSRDKSFCSYDTHI
ncbi:6906_t:CDS:1, partial [Entrophospora sp. SA101]